MGRYRSLKLMTPMYREYLPDRTKGYMVMPDGHELPTLEPPWRGNKVAESCIPEGIYVVRRDKIGRFRYYRLLDVKGRTNIEIHKGTRPSHSEGCILLLTDEDLRVLLHWFGDDDWVLEIKEK
jgi:hypothetical protein